MPSSTVTTPREGQVRSEIKTKQKGVPTQKHTWNKQNLKEFV